MKKYILFFFLPVLLIGLHACDEGRIYENAVVVTGEGRTVKMTGRISGVDKWSGDYSVVVAGFDDESDYAIVSKVVPVSESDNDEIQLTMSGITDEVTTVELCVINKLRKRIVSLVAMECTEIADTILMDAGTVDASMYNAIQQKIFNATCTACHGLSTTPGGGLNLLEGHSHAELVNRASTTVDGKMRVMPGNASESVLHLILGTDISSDWRIDHSQMITSSDMQSLIGNWIDDGAQP